MRKQKILVLSDLNSATDIILKSTISLAKIISGEITLFSVKKPTDIVEQDNQLSAMRTINKEHTVINKKIHSLITPLTKEYGVPIKYSSAFGNVKSEIENYIKASKPDIIVLGKRKSKPFNLIGDNIIQFVLNTFDGPIMIAHDKNALLPNKEISLGVLNGLEPSFNLEFAEDLLGQTQKPVKSFKIINRASQSNELNVSSDKNAIEFLFEQSDNTVKNLSNYLSKSNIDLLFLERGTKSRDNQSNYTMPNMKDIISTLNVTLMVTGEQNYNLANHQ